MKDQNGMKTDKAVSFVTTIKNYGLVHVGLLLNKKNLRFSSCRFVAKSVL